MVDRNVSESYDEPKQKRFGFWTDNRYYLENKHNIPRRKKIMPLVTSKEMLLKAQKFAEDIDKFNPVRRIASADLSADPDALES